MRLVHESTSDGQSIHSADRTALATTVDIADSLASQARGLMFRRSVPDDYALVFRFDSAKVRDLHMLFVFSPSTPSGPSTASSVASSGCDRGVASPVLALI